MSEYPLFELMSQYKPEYVTYMQYHLRNDGKSFEDIEAGRKEDLRRILTEFKDGCHPVFTLHKTLEAMLGPHHEWHSWPGIVQNPNYFDHQMERGRGNKAEKTPEEKHAEYMTKAESALKYRFDDMGSSLLKNPAGTYQWADNLLARLDTVSSLSATIQIVENFMRSRDRLSQEYGKGALLKNLRQEQEREHRRFATHPSDTLLPKDISGLLASHKDRLSYEREQTRDEYQTRDDIEMRRLSEIVTLLEGWKAGAHPLNVLYDVLQVGIDAFDIPFQYLFSNANSQKHYEREYRADHVRADVDDHRRENGLANTLRQKEITFLAARDLLRSFHPEILAFKNADETPEFAAQIDAYIDHVMNSDESSLKLIRTIAETILLPVKDTPKDPALVRDSDKTSLSDEDWENHDSLTFVSIHNLSTLTQIILKLHAKQKEEDAYFEAHKPMGALKTQSEAETRAPLKKIFNRRAQREKNPHEPFERLIDRIQIDASGSAAIKPYPSGEYDDRFDEELYGTTIARISTYSVSFVPKDPARLLELRGRVQYALKQLAEVRYQFQIPFDYEAKYFAYERPSMERSSRYSFEKDKDEVKNNFENCQVTITDGKVQVYSRLDLDDIWHLYYLMEDIIEPSEQIAREMDKARRVEERGMLEQKSDMNDKYSNESMKPEEKMGSLANARPEDYVSESVRQTMSLYALGEIGEEQLVQRAIEMAESTLQGNLVEPNGLLPDYSHMKLLVGDADGEIAPYDKALVERTRDVLMMMAGTDDPNRPLYPALIGAVNKISQPLRNHLRTGAYNEEVARWKKWSERTHDTRSLKDIFGDPEKTSKFQAAWDELDTLKNQANGKAGEEEKTDQRTLAARTNISLRSPDVGHTSNRTWRDTDYVSRAKNSLWVRKDLPAALAKFIVNDNVHPDMRQTLLAITSEPGVR